MEPLRHSSLEAAFRAAVPPPAVPLRQRLTWRLGLKLLSLRIVQRLFEKKIRS